MIPVSMIDIRALAAEVMTLKQVEYGSCSL